MKTQLSDVIKPEEQPELIGLVETKQQRDERILQKVLNRDKLVWGEYLTERRGDIEDVTHHTKRVHENGKVIERTIISFTLDVEVGQ